MTRNRHYSTAQHSFRRDSCILNDLGPSREFGLDVAGKLLRRRAALQLHALLLKATANVRQVFELFNRIGRLPPLRNPGMYGNRWRGPFSRERHDQFPKVPWSESQLITKIMGTDSVFIFVQSYQIGVISLRNVSVGPRVARTGP